MTPTYRTFLERSQHFLRRMLRKPAWEFNRVHPDLWYPRPPRTGGHRHGDLTLQPISGRARQRGSM